MVQAARRTSEDFSWANKFKLLKAVSIKQKMEPRVVNVKSTKDKTRALVQLVHLDTFIEYLRAMGTWKVCHPF